jgi:hypothetical protein
MSTLVQCGKSENVDLCVSILNFCAEERTLTLLNHIVPMMRAYCATNELSCQFIVRDNSPTNSTVLSDKICELAEAGHDIRYFLSPNVGFGAGHNLNFVSQNADIFCVMNNDMAFPHVDWLSEVIRRLRSDPTIGAVGLADENYTLDEQFGFARPLLDVDRRIYLDGSLLFIRSTVFRRLNGFDESYGIAYFEDTDFSFRLKINGYKLETQSIPHQHFRSSATAKLPSSFYSALYEKGRTVFFSRWSGRFGQGLNNRVLITCDHDGIGDFFISLYPLREFLKKTSRLGFSCNVYLRYPELSFLIADIQEIEILSSLPVDLRQYEWQINLAALNMSLPFLSVDLIAAQLGLVDFNDDPQDLVELLSALPDEILIKQYVVCHFDSSRKTFAGRAIGRRAAVEIIRSLIADGRDVIIVGSNDSSEEVNSGYEALLKSHKNITDLRGKTTLVELVSIVARASLFVGIDSGPANIAQTFDVRSLIVFGATLPNTKVYRQNVSSFSNPNVNCLGCYHSNVEYAYNTCLRLDEACVKAIELESLKSFVARVLGGEDINCAQNDGYRRRLREHIMLLIYNPIYKSKAYSLNGVLGKNLSDTIIEVVDTIVQRAVFDARGAKDALVKLRAENLDLRNKLQQSTFSDHEATKSLTALAINQKKLFLEQSDLVDCDVDQRGEQIVVQTRSSDPQIRLPAIESKSGQVRCEFSVRSNEKTSFQVYWSTGTQEFIEAHSVTFEIGREIKVFHWTSPFSKGRSLFLRLDPAQTSCEVEFSMQLFGATGFSEKNKSFIGTRLWRLLGLPNRSFQV